MNALELQNLKKCYGSTTAVCDLTLSLPEGCRLGLLGVNGAGKTTTIGMATGLISPTDGTASVFGYGAGSREAKQLLGLSPQKSAVAGNLTVEENLVFMGQLYGVRNPKARAKALMDAFDLYSYAHKRAKTLSGGFERRLSIAMAMVHEPKLLFLDEPTLGLDVLARRQLHTLISRLPVTLVLTTHDIHEAEKLTDLVAILSRGRLLALDTPEKLKIKTGCNGLEDAFIALTEEERK